jgi:O-Antigen ligase
MRLPSNGMGSSRGACGSPRTKRGADDARARCSAVAEGGRRTHVRFRNVATQSPRAQRLAPAKSDVYVPRVRVRWVLLVTIFLAFVADAGTPYEKMIAPFAWAHDLLFEALPWKIRGIDHITIACLIIAGKSADGKGPRVPPVRAALILSGVTTVVMFLYGVVRGGGAWQASWQTYLIMSSIALSFAIATAFRTPEHFMMLWKVFLWASAYRAVMCILFYFFYVRNQATDPPEYMTSHDDSVLWVVSMLIIILRMIEGPGSRFKLLLLLLLLGTAVLFNQRRIAWVSLTMGSIILFALLRPSKAKKRAMRVVYALAPIVTIYVVVGWGRPERMFKPLQSFATVSTQEDTSTKARNVENLGLIATSNANNPLLGPGWGHPYIEVSNKYSIAAYFPLWQYVPHNSILGLLAYTGVLGFFGYWLVYPTSMFANARMARLSKSPAARQVGLISVTQMVVCANQYYGDMGITYAKSVYILVIAYAAALRLPILAEVWPAPKGARKAAAPGPAVRGVA